MDLEIKALQMEAQKKSLQDSSHYFPRKIPKTLEYVFFLIKDSEFYLNSKDIVKIDHFENLLKKKHFYYPFSLNYINLKCLRPKTDKPSSYKSYVWIHDNNEEKTTSCLYE